MRSSSHLHRRFVMSLFSRLHWKLLSEDCFLEILFLVREGPSSDLKISKLFHFRPFLVHFRQFLVYFRPFCFISDRFWFISDGFWFILDSFWFILDRFWFILNRIWFISDSFWFILFVISLYFTSSPYQ